MLVLNDQSRNKCLIEQIKADDKEFEQHHLKVLNFINEKDQTALDAKEVVCNDHGYHIMDMFS